ncbi:unnamed protein product [Brassica oleracea var. botrytis]
MPCGNNKNRVHNPKNRGDSTLSLQLLYSTLCYVPFFLYSPTKKKSYNLS